MEIQPEYTDASVKAKRTRENEKLSFYDKIQFKDVVKIFVYPFVNTKMERSCDIYYADGYCKSNFNLNKLQYQFMQERWHICNFELDDACEIVYIQNSVK
jgi:hypothetical protein